MTGSIWLHQLPDVLEPCRNVTLYKGWETRARSSGGYNALMGIVVHHTASKSTTVNDTNYMWVVAQFKPVGAIYLARDGEIVIGAAGATNCAGRGGPFTTSKGTIPLDQANSNTISIEAANNGIGEPWPTVQQDAYVTLVAALCEGYGFDPMRDVLSHAEWSPGRKIDPAGPSRWAKGTATWKMDGFRTEVRDMMGAEPPPTPPTGGDEDMLFVCKVGADIFVGDGVRASKVAADDHDTLQANMNVANRWHHPARAGLPLVAKLSDIPVINAGQRDLLVGKVG